jgi:hypothetical protein
MNNNLYLLDASIFKQINVEVVYLKVRCQNDGCNKSWGVNVYNNHINPKDLICKECAQKTVLSQMIENQ